MNNISTNNINFSSFETFLSIDCGLSQKTIESYSMVLKQLIELGDICEDNFKKLLSRYTDKPSTYNQKLFALKSINKFFSKYYDMGNFMENLPMKKNHNNYDIEIPDREELKEIISNISNKKHKLMFQMIYSMGLRVSETTNIKLSDINFEENTLNILRKGNKMETLPVPVNIINKIRANISSNSKYLFPNNRNEKMSRQNFFKVCKKNNMHPHQLRHCFATHSLDAGANINYVQKMLSHASLQTTTRYANLSKKGMAREMEKINLI